MSTNRIKLLCISGVMAALYVGLDFLAVSVSAPFGGTLKLSLSGLPVILVAVLGGPLWGAATGFVGAFVGQLITYGLTPTTLLWVLPAVLRGLSMGWLFRIFKQRMSVSVLTLETVLSSLLVTAANTAVLILDAHIYGYSSTAAVLLGVPARVVSGVITAIAFSLLLPAILPPLKRLFRR